VPKQKNRTDRRRLERLIDDFREVRLLVLGDMVLDEYIWGDVDRISPEAPVPVVHVRDETTMLGGAANAARNVVALGGAVDCCSVIGDDGAGRRVVELLKDLGIDPSGLVHDPERPTTRKSRVIAQNQQIVRFDRETADAPPAPIARELLRRLERLIPRSDGAIIEDYGKGVLSRQLAIAAMKRFAAGGLPVAVDPKTNLAPFKGASVVKPNFKEAEMLSGVEIRDAESLDRAAQKIRKRVGGASLVITRGADGMSLFEEGQPATHVATASRAVFDVQGAGDTAIAALVLALRAGGSLYEAAIVANAASGIVVNKVGTATASADEVKAALPAALEAAQGAS
jgi:D-beta-D-heptose 7-phosphate kinase/D-beta-D-heptose 1-phosphate adenosyltransferase